MLTRAERLCLAEFVSRTGESWTQVSRVPASQLDVAPRVVLGLLHEGMLSTDRYGQLTLTDAGYAAAKEAWIELVESGRAARIRG